MKEHFEIRLDFKPNTGSPERVFLTMAKYVSAFENLVLVVGEGIDPENVVSCELSGVEIGSLKSIVECFSSVGSYCSFLSNIPRLIASHMVDLEEIDTEQQIENLANKLESDVASETELHFPNQANINRLKLAKGIKRLVDASESLAQGETIDIRNKSSNVVYLNTKTRFPREPEDLFQKHYEVIRKNETLLIKRPVFFGNSMWDFKSIERKKSFSASIDDSDWLERFQGRSVALNPGDAITAFVEYVVYRAKGEKHFSYKDHKVLEVGRPIQLQELLDLEIVNEDA